MNRLLSLLLLAICLFPVPSQSAELGVYLGAGCTGGDRLPAFAKWLGRRPDRVVDFISFNSWTDIINESNWAMGCWKTSHIPVSFSIPMLPHGNYTLKEGANGEYDHWFHELAQNMVKNGYGRTILRIGWEFNGGWYPWSAKQDPESWKGFYRHIVMAMRNVPGAHFRFDWCPTSGWQQVTQDQLYPGDDVVDIIGMDVYNQTWDVTATTPEKRWHNTLDGQYGLSWLAKFAGDHKKPISLPEWGTGTRPDGHGGGDDPLFIKNMAEWIASHNIVYHDYWDYHAPDFDAALSDGKQPNAEKAFLAAFAPAKK